MATRAGASSGVAARTQAQGLVAQARGENIERGFRQAGAPPFETFPQGACAISLGCFAPKSYWR